MVTVKERQEIELVCREFGMWEATDDICKVLTRLQHREVFKKELRRKMDSLSTAQLDSLTLSREEEV